MKGHDRAIFRHSYQAAWQNALVAVSEAELMMVKIYDDKRYFEPSDRYG